MKAILGTMTFSDQVDHHVAGSMISTFRNAGNDELDTAFVYCGGNTEKLLGDLQKEGALDNCNVAAKVNPAHGGLTKEAIDTQFTTSLERLNLDGVDLLYLHQPDLNTPITESLEALNDHHQAGRFKRFGLSNYAAWQVAEIAGICEKRDFMMPVVYQGMYNAITRDVERELFKCLQHFNIAFYVYNPLAGGMLTGKHQTVSAKPPEGRFSGNQQYQDRYWKNDYFHAVNTFTDACTAENINPASAALRWLSHHSDLSQEKGDAIILGASSMQHFENNLQALQEGPLPPSVIDALDKGWEIARPECVKYFRP